MSDPAPSFGDALQSETLVDALCRRAVGGTAAFSFLGYDGNPTTELTMAELDRRARAIAVELLDRRLRGEPALLLYAPGADFVAAFFGCLYAGALAVPVYPPEMNRLEHAMHRLASIARNAGARSVLTVSAFAEIAADLGTHGVSLEHLGWIATDHIDDARARSWSDPGVHRHTPAFIQYTSGSTADPRGVLLTHDKLLRNVRAMIGRFGWTAWGERLEIVSWMPMYHDMGLIGCLLAPLVAGASARYLSPLDFLSRPLRWLQAISDGKDRIVASGAPNFAFDLVAKAFEAEPAELDLSKWRFAGCGSEPIRVETLERFLGFAGPLGFAPEDLAPGYGLAEATLMVSCGPMPRRVQVLWVRRSALESGRIETVERGQVDAKGIVGCGRVIDEHEVRVVDPATGRLCDPDQVGELWLRGPCVGGRYWNSPDEDASTFVGDEDGVWLRTGDLGFVREGEIFVTGRLKDMIVVRGRNLYPQDVEAVANAASPALRPGCAVAFAVSAEDGEELGIAVEIREAAISQAEAAIGAIRAAVTGSFGVDPARVAILKPRALPKTSSGKVQRARTRMELAGGALPVVAAREVL